MTGHEETGPCPVCAALGMPEPDGGVAVSILSEDQVHRVLAAVDWQEFPESREPGSHRDRRKARRKAERKARRRTR